MQPDPERIADTKAWLGKAGYDIRSAEVACAAEPHRAILERLPQDVHP